MDETNLKIFNPSSNPNAISPAMLARRWGVSRQTIYNMFADGQLHSFKVRNSRLIRLSEIERIERGGDA